MNLIERLRKRAEIRRAIPRAPSGTPDRISDLLEEAAKALEGNTPGVVIQASEAAQHLANHLVNTQYLYTEKDQAAMHNDELANVIQEYWDSLL